MENTKQNAAADSTKPAAAASTKPAIDLAAYLHAMRLDDPSSPPKQQHYPAPTSLRPPQPPQVPVPSTRANGQQQLLGHYGVGESSRGAGAGYVPPFGSCGPCSSFYASHYGAHSPRFTAPAAPLPSLTAKLSELSTSARKYDAITPPRPSVSPSPSMPSSSASYCQPTSGAAFSAWDRNAGKYDAIAPPRPSVSPSPSMPSSSASHCQPKPGAAFSAWDRNAGKYDAIAPPRPSVSPSPSMPSSSASHCQPTPGAAFSAWDRNARKYDAIAPPRPSVSPSPSMPSSSASHCQPTPGTAFSAWDRNAIAPPRPSVSPSPSMPSSSASHYQTTPGAAFCAWDRDASSLNPYASPFQSAPLATQVENWSWTHAPAVRDVPTLEDVRSRLLRSPMEPALVMLPETSAHVIHLLAEGGDGLRLSVLAGVKRAVHMVMESSVGHAVFIALLRACEGQYGELEGIVHAVAAPNGSGFLIRVVKHDHGVTALKELIREAAPYSQLCLVLIGCLLRERVMERCKGAEVLQYCFATMPYRDCSVMIRFAILNINEMLSSASGSRFLAECFVNARSAELDALEEIILARTSEIARGQYSNYFLQRALEWGSEPLKDAIAERVAGDITSLSADQFGSYVVEACFILPRSLAPLQRVLAAFLGLRRDQLAEMVQGGYSNYVVHKLLTVGKHYFPEQTMSLARQIEKLPAAVQREMHAHGVMRVVNKLFPRHRKPRY